ncbi:collagenase 3-like [Macrosteles quadrilineatus]|uniref:collagenase 3-like n=1 Tax=Macrosteles quadrilineatus TaxID=74068 RepID=UPI0023E0D36A|nr:collagenase 3-like [Macrosteles quadrilineatus]
MFVSVYCSVLTVFMLVSSGNSAPAVGHTQDNEEDSLDAPSYLAEFGYLPPSDPNGPSQIIAAETLAKAIREFQTFMGLEETGVLDRETKKLMKKPRCGIKDQPTINGPSSYKLTGSKWKTNTLSYKITKYPDDFPRDETDRTIKEAFQVWSRVTPLKFIRKTRGNVHIEIKFARGRHGSCEPFKGPLGVLAHAFDPISGGDIHFDDSEPWTINTYEGVNLLLTAAHEIGHALGLEHSKYKNALMYAYAQGYDPNFRLSNDDIRAIQRLYPNQS